MLLKKGVDQRDVHPTIWYALGLVEGIYRINAVKLVVTSLRDGKHKEGSKHYDGLAVDLRTKNVAIGLLDAVYRSVRNVLEPYGFDVVLEKDHIHVEYDPKASERWQWEVD